MKVIARPVGTGKTRELLNMAQAQGGIVLTCNKRALQEKARAYGIPEITIVDWNDLIYGNYEKEKPLFIHKLDDVMEEYFKYDFGVTMAGYSVALERQDGKV